MQVFAYYVSPSSGEEVEFELVSADIHGNNAMKINCPYTEETAKKALKQFYKDIQAWINEGCPKNNSFKFYYTKGLCSNLKMWQVDSGYNNLDNLHSFLEDQFISAGLPSDYPFDLCAGTYANEINKYTNPKRLQWILEHSQE